MFAVVICACVVCTRVRPRINANCSQYTNTVKMRDENCTSSPTNSHAAHLHSSTTHTKGRVFEVPDIRHAHATVSLGSQPQPDDRKRTADRHAHALQGADTHEKLTAVCAHTSARAKNVVAEANTVLLQALDFAASAPL